MLLAKIWGFLFMSFIISKSSLRCWAVVVLLAGLCGPKRANAYEDSNSHEAILGPSFASSVSRSHGLIAGIKNRPRGNLDFSYGTFLGGYMGDARFVTTDVTVGVGVAEVLSLYVGAGLRFGTQKEKNQLQISLGSSIGYLSAAIRRFQATEGPALEGVISFNIPLRLFL
jgi:hypothetical protein